MNKMNKVAHGVILALFWAACWLVWALLQLPLMIRMHGAPLQLPGFTILCRAVGPGLVIVMAALATGYCLWVWFRKRDQPGSWVGFLATATGFLFLVTLPVMVAIYLPLVGAIVSLPAR
jgi:hypothetical protein